MRNYVATAVLRCLVWEGEPPNQFSYLAKLITGYPSAITCRAPVENSDDDMSTLIVTGIPAYGQASTTIALYRGDSLVFDALRNTFYQVQGEAEAAQLRPC